MNITLHPMRHAARLTVVRHGDVLTLNGEDFDFTDLPDAMELPAAAIDSPWICGPVARQGGVLTVPLVLPHGACAPRATLYPEPLNVAQDGPVALPAYQEDTA